ncbi:MAG: hypothetical protein A2843_01230 [Candidatus Wildermuthbacteria bacterium RIFCSPHIGHO2_01_FULL_48_27b]|uniref:Endonuclease/exonuclease/phosphatase domain-containing protein n=2 Tax=Candidatus Wildermuthiibacteriota TaxID=1817923 RepID=A0A1G2QUU4_9BACT|nr:MAG: hypothetical protein A2843_01230 [Candidatus Wildermuthbacteria bacterium RIFCSPHIGHO2_01_FULL_48_27b]
MRVVTYNTQAGLPGRTLWESLKAYLYVFKIRKFAPRPSVGMRRAIQMVGEDFNADILCLQEIPAQWMKAVQDLLRASGYRYFSSGTTKSRLRWHVGILIASKIAGRSFEVHLPQENTLRGGGGSAGISLLGVTIIGTHLGWGGAKILTPQFTTLASLCRKEHELGQKVLILGDFNRTNISLLGLRELSQLTHPSWRPNAPLDHILVDPSARIKQCNVFRGDSDHLGLCADIVF